MSEKDYIRGNQAAWRTMLAEVSRHLDDGNKTQNELMLELLSVRAELTELANYIGGNIPPNMHLGDAVRKCIAPNVRELFDTLESRGSADEQQQ